MSNLNTHGTFPRSKRFVEQESEVPGPGSYNPLIDLPDPLYKKGAMLERAGRFTTEDLSPDTFGLYGRASPGGGGGGGSKENRRPRTVSASGVHARVQADDKQRMIAMHDKEISRLQLKLVKLESTKEELTKERIESRNEVGNLKSEIRTLTSQLLKSSTSLTKHTASLPILQKKLEELTSSHHASSKRKDLELTNLNSQVDSLNNSLNHSKADLEDRDSLQVITSTALVTLTNTAKEVMDNQFTRITGTEWEEVKLEKYELELRNLSWEKTILARISQVSALYLFAQEKEEELIFSDEIILALEEELNWRREEESTRVSEELDSRLREKEWRRRSRAYERELLSLREEIESHQLELDLYKDWEEIFRFESDAELDELQFQIEELESELDIVESEYIIATEEEIPRLEAELLSLTKSSAVERETLWRTERSLREFQEREREERERREGEIEELSRRLGEKERESERERGERKRILGLLGTTRSSECGLREELELMTEAYHASQLLISKAQHTDRTVDELARKNAAAEYEVAELRELNVGLISHENPNQKIKHIAMIREQLAESKRLHLQTTSLLASTKAENQSLLEELSVYRSVSVLPPSSFTNSLPSHRSNNANTNSNSYSTFPVPPQRTKVQRPDLGDVFSSTSNSNSVASGSSSISTSSTVIHQGVGLGLVGGGGNGGVVRGSIRRQSQSQQSQREQPQHVTIVEPPRSQSQSQQQQYHQQQKSHQQQQQQYEVITQPWKRGMSSIIHEESEEEDTSGSMRSYESSPNSYNGHDQDRGQDRQGEKEEEETEGRDDLGRYEDEFSEEFDPEQEEELNRQRIIIERAAISTAKLNAVAAANHGGTTGSGTSGGGGSLPGSPGGGVRMEGRMKVSDLW